MSLTIKTNLSSLIAQGSLTNSTNKLNQAIERMTTGYKINHASDNAANYSISTNMTTKINAYQVAEDNVSMGLDLVQTASSTLESMGDLTTRFRALATQAQNGTYGNQSISALTKEANSIVAEINRLQTTAEYNGIKLFEATSSTSTPTQGTTSKFIAPITCRDTSSMTKLSSVDENTELTSGTYSISTAEELAKLATMTNNGKIGANTEFVLAKDIDLSEYCSSNDWVPIGLEGIDEDNADAMFKAKFEGNGYAISNLTVSKSDAEYAGLFGGVTGSIKNLNLMDVYIQADDAFAAGVALGLMGGVIENCRVTGRISGGYAGGIALSVEGGTIKNCASSLSIVTQGASGGLIQGFTGGQLLNSFFDGRVVVNMENGFGGGLVAGFGDNITMSNCYSAGNVTSPGEAFALGVYFGNLEPTGVTIKNCYYDNTRAGQSVGTNVTPDYGVGVDTNQLNALIANGTLPSAKYSPTDAILPNGDVTGNLSLILQVGVNSNGSSQIGLTLQGIDLSVLNNLDLQSDTVFETLDSILAKINEQQTNLGATQNRLMSALDEISTQYENLVSSRSTLKDADIADVSSEYIKMQILQNASATLLATANQSPALALQLL